MANRSHEIGGEPSDRIRILPEVLDRTLVLGAVVAVSFGAPRAELSRWLADSRLASALTGEEREFIQRKVREKRLVNNITWQSERLVVLLWALSMIPELPPPDTQCRTSELERLLPPYGDLSLVEFCESAKLRTEDELFDAAFLIQELHALARQRQRDPMYKTAEPAVDQEVLQERHHAINWLVGYGGQSWNQVATDT